MSIPAAGAKPDSRKCILSAATKLFARLGLHKCSTREIAKASDSNISLISYYFGGKEGLYKEVMRNYALEIKENTQAIELNSSLHPMSKEVFTNEISQMVEIMIRLRLKNPEMAQIFAREKLTGMPYAKEVHDEIFYPMIQKFFAVFKSGQKHGVVRSDINPAFFFVTFSEGLFGFYEILECQTAINKDFGDLANNPVALREQILKIYLTGVLL
ncbi:MAG: TetR family transcriptional regulator [Bdellovibrionaceae bacterium]|nr:TetR family transcriptional regulator [Bdellovibrio sp.]